VLHHGFRALAFGLGQQVFRVATLVGVEAPLVQLHGEIRHAVKEPAVVRDDEERAAEVLQKLRDPLDRFGVQMVRRFVEDQQVRPRDNGPRHGDAPLFAAGERGDVTVARRGVEVGHGGAHPGIKAPAVELGDACFQLRVALRVRGQGFELGDEVEHVFCPVADVFEDVLGGIEREFLREVADDQVAARGHFARVRRALAGEHFEEGGLARAVAPDKADAIALVQCKRGVVKDDSVIEGNNQLVGRQQGGGGISHSLKGPDVRKNFSVPSPWFRWNRQFANTLFELPAANWANVPHLEAESLFTLHPRFKTTWTSAG